MKKTTLLILFTLLLPNIVLGQYHLQNNEELDSFNAIPKEQVFIHSNDNLLLSGEYLYYKFYCRNTANRMPSKISKIAYVALLGKSNNLIFQHKIKLDNGLGQGDFFIPVDIKTGHYKLIGFTQWMRNQGEPSFFIEDIIILNPYQGIPELTDESATPVIVHSRSDRLIRPSTPEEEEEKKEPSFQIQLEQRTFGKRQLVKFNVQKVIEQGASNLSISVRKKDSVALPFEKKAANTIEIPDPTLVLDNLKPNDSIYLPEMRGELISGRIISKTSRLPVSNANISLSIAGNNGLTKVSRSNEKGTFYFNLDTGTRNNQVILNILGVDKNEFEIILDSTALNVNSFDFKEISISPDLNPIFEQRSIYNQIENAFFDQKKDSTITASFRKPAHRSFQEIHVLDDYTRFKTLKETIVEIIEDVLVKKRKGQYRLQVRGPDEFFINSADTPLVYVDKVLVKNTTSLFELDVKQIQQIGISRNEFYIGPKRYQGIFSVTTKNGDYLSQVNSEMSFIRELPGPIPVKKYYEQDYSESNKTKHIADYRHQLLWLPNIRIDKAKTFEFYTSDNIGTYEISIEGFTANGSPISLSEKIYVQ